MLSPQTPGLTLLTARENVSVSSLDAMLTQASRANIQLRIAGSNAKTDTHMRKNQEGYRHD